MISARAAPAALDELWSHVGRAYYNYRLLLERTLRSVGLEGVVTPGMGHVLFTLFEGDGCIVREIAEKTRLSFPTITVVLQRMKKVGLVEMRPDPEDRRAVRVRLTPLGRSIEPRCGQVVRRLREVLERGLSKRDVAVLKRSLARMVENLREDEESTGG